MCMCRKFGFLRLLFGVAGPDDPRDEGQRAAWRERRRRFRSRVRAAVRELLEEDEPAPSGSQSQS
jgi:hypothetical protein